MHGTSACSLWSLNTRNDSRPRSGFRGTVPESADAEENNGAVHGLTAKNTAVPEEKR